MSAITGWNRREFLARTAGGLAGALAAHGQSPARRPNILFILADDLGYGDVGVYGQKTIPTPNIDRIAREGTRFTQAYAGSAVCAPSRCALMTGYHTGHARIRGNLRVPLESSDITVAKVMKDAGYRTGIVGKWGLGNPYSPGIPNLQGFDDWFGFLDQGYAHTYYPQSLWDNKEERIIAGNLGTRKVWVQDLFTQRALSFLDQKQANPFFLYLAFTSPHANDELGNDTNDGMEVPDDEPYHQRPWPQVEKNFASMVTRLDRDVGRVLDQLKKTGQEDNTLVIFASDNGPHREGGHDPTFFHSGGPLRGIKRDLYEGGIRVPMLARWPGVIQPGSLNDQVWAFWDFLPTAAELAGATPPNGIDGISMAPTLLGRPQRNHEYLYWEFHERGFSQAVRMGDWKGVRPGVGAPLELYDLHTDLAETTNVASAHPDVVTRMEEILKSARVDSKEFPIHALPAPRPPR
ncbi:MAG TPA: arylsulfatase [Candidatus Solibacter sp.]|nr:arylsulfatase [Candidatus Solibacter sp.]